MGTTRQGEAGRQQAMFVFDYGEQGPWEPQAGESVTEAFVRHLRGQEWSQASPGEDALSAYYSPEIRTIADLEAVVRESMVDPDQPEDVLEIPFAKLAALMDQGGWSFVGGAFSPFEGNKNDSEITVVLAREAPRS